MFNKLRFIFIGMLIIASIVLLMSYKSRENTNKTTLVPEETKMLIKIEKVQDIIDIIEKADRIVLTQKFESDKKVVLSEEQVKTIISEMSSLEEVEIGSPRGAAYPGYELSIFEKNVELLAISIDDPIYMEVLAERGKATHYYYDLYFSGAEGLWQTVVKLLPMKETHQGTLDNLYKAHMVEVIIEEMNGFKIEYDLKTQPELSWRRDSLIAPLNDAKVGDRSNIKGNILRATIVFYFDNYMEKIELYVNHAIFNDEKFFIKEGLWEIYSFIISAG